MGDIYDSDCKYISALKSTPIVRSSCIENRCDGRSECFHGHLFLISCLCLGSQLGQEEINTQNYKSLIDHNDTHVIQGI